MLNMAAKMDSQFLTFLRIKFHVVFISPGIECVKLRLKRCGRIYFIKERVFVFIVFLNLWTCVE